MTDRPKGEPYLTISGTIWTLHPNGSEPMRLQAFVDKVTAKMDEPWHIDEEDLKFLKEGSIK